MSEHRRKPKFHKCQQDGCQAEGIACYLPDWDDEPKGDSRPDFYYCWEHCQQNGFCKLCGQFWGGVEMFDFGSGFCEFCEDAVQYDFGEYDRADEDMYEYLDESVYP